MTDPALLRTSNRQGLEKILRLTTQWTMEDEEEAAQERLLQVEDSNPQAPGPEQDKLLSPKPSETPEVDEDEGFGDWSQRPGPRGLPTKDGGREVAPGDTSQELEPKQTPSHGHQQEDVEPGQAQIPLEELCLSPEGEPREGPEEPVQGPQELVEAEEAEEAEEELPRCQQPRTPSPLALEEGPGQSTPPQSPTTEVGRAPKPALLLSVWLMVNVMTLGKWPGSTLGGQGTYPCALCLLPQDRTVSKSCGRGCGDGRMGGGKERMMGGWMDRWMGRTTQVLYVPGADWPHACPLRLPVGTTPGLGIQKSISGAKRKAEVTCLCSGGPPDLLLSGPSPKHSRALSSTQTAGRTPKLARQPSLELPSMTVASTKNLWETGEVQAQSTAKGASCKDIVAGDMSRRSLWEQRGGSKTASSVKSTPSGKRYKFVATGHGKYEKVLVGEGAAP
ncbi:lymphocyte-specific protein 1 [Echinops telfairi]|uniref:Lymphocyte-specific protein 1 n=1 Tax=Echinops telfairi TaxID=9371 RepID=A0AC55D3P6_ECHTE|nr:lymphocyte-specific protein 1 [Echinops telfairi]